MACRPGVILSFVACWLTVAPIPAARALVFPLPVPPLRILPSPAGAYAGVCGQPIAGFGHSCSESELRTYRNLGFPTPGGNLGHLDIHTLDYVPATSEMPAHSAVAGRILVTARWFQRPDAPSGTSCLGMVDYQEGLIAYLFEGQLEWDLTPLSARGVGEVTLTAARQLPVPIPFQVLGELQVDLLSGQASFQAHEHIDEVPGSRFNQMCVHLDTIALGIMSPTGNGMAFIRTGGPPPLTAFGDIVVQAVAEQPTLTEEPHAVHRATLTVWEQKGGRVRLRAPGETLDDYEDFLRSQLATQVDEITTTVDANGAFTPLGEPGLVVFHDVPLFTLEDAGNGGTWRAASYTIEVHDAETDEQALDDQGDPIPGATTQLSFADKLWPDVAPATGTLAAPLQIPLVALAGTELKRRIATNLIVRCPTQYGSSETAVLAHLDALDALTDGPSAAQEEAVRRAVWAERAVATAHDHARALIGELGRAIAAILADAIDDALDLSSRRVKAAKKERERILAGELPTDFEGSVGANPKARGLAALGDDDLLRQVDIAGRAKKLVKGSTPDLKLGLQAAGMSPVAAGQVADLFSRSLVALLGLFESHSLVGAIKPELKRIFEEQAALYLEPLLLASDNSASYCSRSQSALADLPTQLTQWSQVDETAYRFDRGEVLVTLHDMNAEAGYNAQFSIDLFSALASGFDAAQDKVEAIGLKQVAKVAQAEKYIMNGGTLVTAAVEVFARLPEFARRGSYAAFGLAPPAGGGGGGGGSAAPGGGGTGPVPSAQPYREALAALRASLAGDQIGAILDMAAGATPGGYVEAGRAFGRATDHFLDAALGYTGGGAPDATSALANALLRRGEFRVLETELVGRVRALYVGVLAGDYAGPSDPSYRQDRALAIGVLDGVLDGIDSLLERLTDLASRTASASFLPAVVVDSVEVTSNATGGELVTASPEAFTVRARVRNLADTPVSGVEPHLGVVALGDAATVQGAATQSLGTLAAADGTDGSGADEVEVVWSVQYTGGFADDVIRLRVDLLEGGDLPTSFVDVGAQGLLPIDPALSDADLDGLPTSYEQSHGLDAAVDDAHADRDGDGLDNTTEREIGTEPDQADSDGDGLSDAAEVYGASGFPTDPRVADSDGDGSDDGSDGAPLDPTTSDPATPPGEPVVATDRTSVVLSAAQPIADVLVSNAGAGELAWTAVAESPTLLALDPARPGSGAPPGTLLIAMPEGFEPTGVSALHTRVTVRDVSGAFPDEVDLDVTLVPEPAGAAPAALLALLGLAASAAVRRRHRHRRSGSPDGLWA